MSISKEYNERKERIKAYIESAEYNPMPAEEIACKLCVPVEDMEVFKAMLGELADEGRIICSKKGRYLSLASKQAVRGVFRCTSKGYGFVTPDGKQVKEDDLYVSKERTGGALNGDIVLATRLADDEGEIIGIPEKKVTEFVGTYRCKKNGTFAKVVPDDERICHDFFIREKPTKSLRNGMKVVAEITVRPFGKRAPECKVTETIGMVGEPGVDVMSVIRSYGIPTEFPSQVLDEVEKISGEIDVDALIASGERRDLRDICTITIDGADAKDLDDAVSVERLDGGLYRLGVHIADVSHYVREGSALDEEAYARGTSVYFVDRVIPMLPERLSNDLCSLNPNIPRLAFSVVMDVDRNGGVVNHEIFESVICTNERMTYDDVFELLEHRDEAGNAELAERYADILPMLEDMRELSAIIREKRRLRGGVDFDFPENQVILDEEQKPIDIVPRTITVANNIIEDFMLTANETVAERFFWEEMPFVYRIHEKPAEDKVRSFATFVFNLGYRLKSTNAPHPKAFQELLLSCKGQPEERMISTVALRTMQKAVYSPENAGHFGLAAKYYSHFTSPIRRYPDLLIHRIIKKILNGETMYDEETAKMSAGRYNVALLDEMAQHCSMTERRAEDAERDVEDIKKYEYMKQFVGCGFDGVISGMTSFGMFVELDNSVEGMVHINNMIGDFYNYDEKSYTMTGDHTGKVFRLGDRVEVTVLAVEPQEKRMDLMLDEDWEAAVVIGRNRAKKNGRPMGKIGSKKGKLVGVKSGGKAGKGAKGGKSGNGGRRGKRHIERLKTN